MPWNDVSVELHALIPNVHPQALEEVEKNFLTMRCMLAGDGEVEPNPEQISQLALEVCKEHVIALIILNLHILGWEVSMFSVGPTTQ